MNSHLTTATEALLNPGNITELAVAKVLGNMLGSTVDAADIYFQSTYHESWSLEDGEVKHGSFNVERGVGVRAIAGEKTGFAYSDEVELPALEQAASAAKSIVRQGGEKSIQTWSHVAPKPLYPAINPIPSFSQAEKIALLQAVDREARRFDPRVTQVEANLSAVHEVMLVAQSDGTMAADVRPLVRLNVSVIVEEKGRREQGYAGGGCRGDYHHFMRNDLALSFAREAVRIALINLQAVNAPAGTMPVVLGPGWPGVLLHEAVGHGLEGDFIRKGTSAFANRLGQRVAAPGVTVVDDATLLGRRGSLTVDDEGTPGEKTVLIEDGILKGYMLDKLNARLLGMQSTGNCRRESYAHIPQVRMTNTYMLAGQHTPSEIISTVKRGIYAVNFGGGQVDITSGKFVFSTNEAYLIEDGKVTKPVKGATLIGNGPDVLTKVSMIGNDLQLDSGIGVCGKEGQSVPVGVGQPTLKVDALTVGGTDN